MPAPQIHSMILVLYKFYVCMYDSDEIWYVASWINVLQNHIIISHLTWIMSLHYLLKIKCSLRTWYHRVVRERNSKIYPTLKVAYKFARFESFWLYCVGIVQENVYKTRITDLDQSTTVLMNGCGNDDVIQLDPLHFQSLFLFVHISDACFVYLLLQYSPHAVISWIKSGKVGSHS